MTGKQLFAPDLLDHEFVSVAIKKAGSLSGQLIEHAMEDFLELHLTRCTLDMRAQWRLARNHQPTGYRGLPPRPLPTIHILEAHDIVLPKVIP